MHKISSHQDPSKYLGNYFPQKGSRFLDSSSSLLEAVTEFTIIQHPKKTVTYCLFSHSYQAQESWLNLTEFTPTFRGQNILCKYRSISSFPLLVGPRFCSFPCLFVLLSMCFFLRLPFLLLLLLFEWYYFDPSRSTCTSFLPPPSLIVFVLND